MSRMDFLRQGGTPFDGFLYARLGEDSAGNSVSVLSALARLGLDPWEEAAVLSDLPRDGAAERLSGLLTRVRDVPTLGSGQAAILSRLIGLLPRDGENRGGDGLVQAATARLGGLGPVLALLLVILFLLQIVFSGASGPDG